jgi:hypothetical protein
MGRETFFRPFMSEVNNFAKLGVKITLSTGTLPPSVVEAFCVHFGLTRAHFKIHRQPSIRRNVHYAVLPPVEPTVVHAKIPTIIDTLRKDVLPRFAPSELQHIIVYCEARNHVDNLVKILNQDRTVAQATGYHSGMPLADSEASLSAWKAGKYSVLVATSGLMMGLHVPTVRLVVVIGLCFGLTYCYQGASRAGRDGQGALVCFIPDVRHPSSNPPDTDICGIQAYSEVVHAQTCRIQPLSAFFDGEIAADVPTCRQQGSQVLPCDLCDPSITKGVKEIIRPSAPARTPSTADRLSAPFAAFQAQQTPMPGYGNHIATINTPAPPSSSLQSLYAAPNPSPPFSLPHILPVISSSPLRMIAPGGQSLSQQQTSASSAHRTTQLSQQQSASAHIRHRPERLIVRPNSMSSSQLSMEPPRTPNSRPRSDSTSLHVPEPEPKRRRRGSGTPCVMQSHALH